MECTRQYTSPAQWESPLCAYCSSMPAFHKQIWYNVKNTGLSMVECTKCGLRFYSPRVKWEALRAMGFGIDKGAEIAAETFYQNCNFTPVADPEQQRRATMGLYKNIIKQVIAFNSSIPLHSIFEVGCCIGLFLLSAQELGFTSLTGVDFNRYYVQVARDKYGLNVTEAVFDEYDPAGKLYDLTVAFDYIEHSYTPFSDLKKLGTMTRTGGYIALKTFIEEWDTERSMVGPIGHPYHFFGYMLRRMIEESGFDILAFAKYYTNQAVVIGRKR